MDSIIGSIQLFSFDFTPEGWLPCQGQTVDDTEYPQLWSLIAQTYGGDGRGIFQLPNLTKETPNPHMQYYICVKGNMPTRSS